MSHVNKSSVMQDGRRLYDAPGDFKSSFEVLLLWLASWLLARCHSYLEQFGLGRRH
eukprot:jgi/Botrbrau1/7488/Bobra.0095s0024.1